MGVVKEGKFNYRYANKEVTASGTQVSKRIQLEKDGHLSDDGYVSGDSSSDEASGQVKGIRALPERDIDLTSDLDESIDMDLFEFERPASSMPILSSQDEAILEPERQAEVWTEDRRDAGGSGTK